MNIFTKRFSAVVSLLIIATVAISGATNGKSPQKSFMTPQERMEMYANNAQRMMANKNARPSRAQKAPLKVQELDEPEVILYEDFSLMAAGSEETPDAQMLPEDYFTNGNQFLPDGYTHTSGWWGVGIYQAGGTCFLGYPNFGGTITTPMLNLNGRIRISFRAKPGANIASTAQMLVTVLHGDVFSPAYLLPHGYEAIVMDKGTDWQEYSYTYDIPYTGNDAYVQFNGAMRDNGKFIDDIKIERLGYILSAPVAEMPTDYAGDSFTAKWNEQGATNEYLLTAWSEVVPEGDNVVTTDFSDEILPEGLTLNSQPVFAEIPGTNDKALQVKDGNELIIDAQGGLISSFKLSLNAIDEAQSGELCSIVWIDQWVDGEWKEYGNVEVSYSNVKTDAVQIVGGNGMPANMFGKIRLQFLFLNPSDRAYVDDIELICTPVTETEYVAKQLPVSGTSYTLTGLNPEQDYFYYVQAVAGDEISEPSNIVKGYLLVAPNVLPATDVDRRGGFTANWECTPKAEEYSVTVFSMKTVENDSEAFPIFEDSFSNVPATATLNNPLELGNYSTPLTLDEYTDMPGWQGVNNIVANNMIGCGTISGQDFPELLSPYFDASNNGGIFTVEFDVWGERAGDILAVQHSELAYDFVYLSNEVQHCSMTFDKGSKESLLIFYTYYQYPFLIGNVKVTQALPEGTQLVTVLAQSDWADETSHYFAGLKSTETNKLYYKVSARYNREGEYYTSPDSELMDINAGTTTGIENFESKTEDTAIYDLQGRKLDNINVLRHGLYIKNGKVVMK